MASLFRGRGGMASSASFWLRHCYTTKKLLHVKTTVTKMHFVSSHDQVYSDNFHNRLSAHFQSSIFIFTEVLPWVLTQPTNYFILPSKTCQLCCHWGQSR